ncbi:hypothetical protein CCHR01_19906 [Colletotrichum chrysophilum]|uniref:BZIP domain-containing protein n=1 Tax=Colletotrichum chrysophilum TaxID=1836956 RepID=A0AAD8ZZQ1_9PEZI|nr:hypothetical protein CCHR01_19906 [Colletotrichum chrysophilum]
MVTEKRRIQNGESQQRYRQRKKQAAEVAVTASDQQEPAFQDQQTSPTRHQQSSSQAAVSDTSLPAVDQDNSLIQNHPPLNGHINNSFHSSFSNALHTEPMDLGPDIGQTTYTPQIQPSTNTSYYLPDSFTDLSAASNLFHQPFKSASSAALEQQSPLEMEDFFTNDDFGIDRMMSEAQPESNEQIQKEVQAGDMLPLANDAHTGHGSRTAEDSGMLSPRARASQQCLLRMVDDFRVLHQVCYHLLLVNGGQIPGPILLQLVQEDTADIIG